MSRSINDSAPLPLALNIQLNDIADFVKSALEGSLLI
jgi:hypothetical protein